jgi:hypothetical protein
MPKHGERILANKQIKANRAMPKVLTRLRINEISTVDRGAGEGVKITLMKRANKAASESLTGDSKPKEARMSFFQKLFARKAPADIRQATAALAESVKSIVEDDHADKSKLLGESFDQFEEHLKSVAAAPAVDTGKTGTMEDAMSPDVLKALGLTETADNAAVLKAIVDLTEKAKKPPPKDDDEDDDAEKRAKAAQQTEQEKVAKQVAELPESIRKQLEEHAAMKKTVEKLQADADLVAIKKIAADALLPDSAVEPLSKLYKTGDAKSVETLVGMLKAANSALHASDLLKELGGQGSSVTQTALDELNARAAEMRKHDPKLTKEAAFAKVYSDPENIALVKRERQENAPRV